MNSIVIEPTTTAQWQSLVSEAEDNAKLQLDETLESYLVFTLMRFTQRPELTNSIIALEFLDGIQSQGQQQHDQLRDVGDKCLLLSGLFPLMAKRRLLNLGYFVNMGRSAYQQLHDTIHGFYGQLATDFVPMMDVLQAIGELNQQNHQFDLLDNFELWNETDSQLALNRIKTASNTGQPFKHDSDTRH